MMTTKVNPATLHPFLPSQNKEQDVDLFCVQFRRVACVHVFLLLRGPHHTENSLWGRSQAAFQLCPWGSVLSGSSIVNGATDVGVRTGAIPVALGYLYTSLL